MKHRSKKKQNQKALIFFEGSFQNKLWKIPENGSDLDMSEEGDKVKCSQRFLDNVFGDFEV